MGVKVENFQGRLRLRWSHEGQRYYLPGWKNTELGRSLAQRRASLIDTNIAMGNFDPTLDRYRSGAKERSKASGVSTAQLFEQFTAHKRKGDITDRTAVNVQGGAIDGHNFRNRAWVTVLKDAGVPYRTPYTTRHTFISHSLRVQRDEDVARMAGHKVETMRKHYAADVFGGLQCPQPSSVSPATPYEYSVAVPNANSHC
jgi:integrase